VILLDGGYVQNARLGRQFQYGDSLLAELHGNGGSERGKDSEPNENLRNKTDFKVDFLFRS